MPKTKAYYAAQFARTTANKERKANKLARHLAKAKARHGR